MHMQHPLRYVMLEIEVVFSAGGNTLLCSSMHPWELPIKFLGTAILGVQFIGGRLYRAIFYWWLRMLGVFLYMNEYAHRGQNF